MGAFVKGQRWINESEPELGVGVVVDAAPGRVFLLFRTSNAIRQYAVDSAPIRRVEFREGDTIKIHDGSSLVVETVEDRAGILTYLGAGRVVPETDLSDTLSFRSQRTGCWPGRSTKIARSICATRRIVAATKFEVRPCADSLGPAST